MDDSHSCFSQMPQSRTFDCLSREQFSHFQLELAEAMTGEGSHLSRVGWLQNCAQGPHFSWGALRKVLGRKKAEASTQQIQKDGL